MADSQVYVCVQMNEPPNQYPHCGEGYLDYTCPCSHSYCPCVPAHAECVPKFHAESTRARRQRPLSPLSGHTQTRESQEPEAKVDIKPAHLVAKHPVEHAPTAMPRITTMPTTAAVEAQGPEVEVRTATNSARAEEVEVCELQAARMREPTTSCAAPCKETHRLLELILTRVAEVEHAIGGVAAGIAKYDRDYEVQGADTHVGGNDHAPNNADSALAPDVDVQTQNPPCGHPCTSHHTGPENPTPPPPVVTPCTEHSTPVLVNLGSTSDGTGGGAAFQCKKRTPELRGKRVNRQPRARVVPCHRRVIGSSTTSTNSRSSEGATTNHTAAAVKYRDPPGYSDVRDFAIPDKPYYTPPRMKPRSNGVRNPALWPHFFQAIKIHDGPFTLRL